MMLQVLINPKGDTIENKIESEVSAEQTAYAWGGFSPRSGSVLLSYLTFNFDSAWPIPFQADTD
jgi:hypothetical protein